MLGWILAAAITVANAGQTLRADGVGHPPADKTGPQAYLMARRAAQIVAVRNLGLAESGEHLRIRQGIIRWSGTVRGYQVTSVRAMPHGPVTVTVSKAPQRGRRPEPRRGRPSRRGRAR